MADLAGLSANARQAGIFTDFDGVLAPIVSDPDDAKALPGANRLLARLARTFSVVAVVSGRAALDLASRVKAHGVHLVGSHGMEEIFDGTVRVSPEAESARGRIESAAIALRAELRGARGVILEHKGLALAVHYRRAVDPGEAEALTAPIVERVAKANDLDVLSGRRILEVRPRSVGNKGDAVRTLIERHHLKAALVAGDDVGDLPAFDALDALEIAVRIAVASDESPPELSAKADIVVGSPQELMAMLRKLAG